MLATSPTTTTLPQTTTSPSETTKAPSTTPSPDTTSLSVQTTGNDYANLNWSGSISAALRSVWGRGAVTFTEQLLVMGLLNYFNLYEFLKRWMQALVGKLEKRCFCWFPAAIFVPHKGTPTCRLRFRISRIWNIAQTCFLARIFACLSSFIPRFWTFCIKWFAFLFLMTWQKTENGPRLVASCQLGFLILLRCIWIISKCLSGMPVN